MFVNTVAVFSTNLYHRVTLLLSDSTRSLYERKLKEAMSKEKRGKPASDKTFYREEGNITACLSYFPVLFCFDFKYMYSVTDENSACLGC